MRLNLYPPRLSIRHRNRNWSKFTITQIPGREALAVIHLSESINFNSANLHDRINLNKSLHDNEERVEITELNFAFGNDR